MAKKKGKKKLKRTGGNMYFNTATWNPLRGRCSHRCPYCFVPAYGRPQKELHLDEAAFDYDLNSAELEIFVCSGCDIGASDVKDEWVIRILNYIKQFPEAKIFLQSKCPGNLLRFAENETFKKSTIVTTIETNRDYKKFMGLAPSVQDRAEAMEKFHELGFNTRVTIEPIMAFDRQPLVDLIKKCHPSLVRIGTNTNWNFHVPEPEPCDVWALIHELEEFTTVEMKNNLRCWLRNH